MKLDVLRPGWDQLQEEGIVNAEGARLFRSDGSSLLDAAGQFGVNAIGFGRKDIADVIAETIWKRSHLSPTLQCPERIALAEVLKQKWLHPNLDRVHFVNSGSEANEAAIRLARHYHYLRGKRTKWKIISREYSYHGTTMGALSMTTNAFRRKGLEPYLAEMPVVPSCYCAEGESENSVNKALDALRATIESHGADSIAAMIVEPIGASSSGATASPPEYWQEVEELCRQHDILLISDEVVTGFGRTGSRMGYDQAGFVPDIISMAKGLTGGYGALGAVSGRGEIFEVLEAGGLPLFYHTLGGNPPACAAAFENLKVIEEENLLDRVDDMGSRLGELLRPLRFQKGVKDVRGVGMLWAVEVEPLPGLDIKPSALIVKKGIEKGVFYWPGGVSEDHNIICFAPPFTVSEEDLIRMVVVLEDVISELYL
ncbi:aspartate aminotransferase family protein [Maricurvus nonylphenolicus]